MRPAIRLGLRPVAMSGTIAAPTPILGWDGQFDPNVTPPDPAGAVGTDRYVELVNQRYGIYDKMGTLKSSGDLGTLTGHTLGCLADPSVLWDTWQSRSPQSIRMMTLSAA